MVGRFNSIKSIVDRFNAIAENISYPGQYSPPVYQIGEIARFKRWTQRASSYSESYLYSDFIQFFDCNIDNLVIWFIEISDGNFIYDQNGGKIPLPTWVNVLQFYSDMGIIRTESRAKIRGAGITAQGYTYTWSAWNADAYYYGFYHYFVTYNNKIYRNKFSSYLLTGNRNKNPETEPDYWIELTNYSFSPLFNKKWFEQINQVLEYCENYVP